MKLFEKVSMQKYLSNTGQVILVVFTSILILQVTFNSFSAVDCTCQNLLKVYSEVVN